LASGYRHYHRTTEAQFWRPQRQVARADAWHSDPLTYLGRSGGQGDLDLPFHARRCASLRLLRQNDADCRHARHSCESNGSKSRLMQEAQRAIGL
jgi:hypothetical protein